MRQTLTAGIVAGSLILSSFVAAPGAGAQTERDSSSATGQAGNYFDGEHSSTADPSETRIPALDPNPNDPLRFPDPNPLDTISSSNMFLDWTKDMEEGEGKDVVQAWAKNSSIPDTANPLELFKAEAQGSTQMSSGLFTGDFELSSGGSSQATSVLLTVLVGWLVVGSVIELVMRGLRMAGVTH